MRFNYVILDSNNIYNKVMFYDVVGLKNVNYIPFNLYMGIPKLLCPLVKICMSTKLNRYVKFPFKFYCLKRLLANIQFTDNAPICFLLTRNWFEIGYSIGLLDYLRQCYPNARFVLYLIDLFHTYKDMYPNKSKPFNIDTIKKEFNLIISYDKGDCCNYGFLYYPDVYSVIKMRTGNKNFPDTDVFFCGKAKDRLPFILKIAKILNVYGLKIHFCIVDAPFDSQQNIPGVCYLDKLMSYWDYLLYMQHSKCILEVMQGGASGYTLRAMEAISYNKMLLTDNPHISSIRYYHPDYISIIRQGEANSIDFDFLHKIRNGILVDYQYDNGFSPLHLLEYIESVL